MFWITFRTKLFFFWVGGEESWNFNTVSYSQSLSLKTGLRLYSYILEANMVHEVTKRHLTYRGQCTRDFFKTWDAKGEGCSQRLGYIWNSPGRQVFSPECHFHLNSLDYLRLQPTYHLFLHSLEQLQRGDDLIPDKKGVRITCVPENSDRLIPFQVTTTTAVSSL